MAGAVSILIINQTLHFRLYYKIYLNPYQKDSNTNLVVALACHRLTPPLVERGIKGEMGGWVGGGEGSRGIARGADRHRGVDAGAAVKQEPHHILVPLLCRHEEARGAVLRERKSELRGRRDWTGVAETGVDRSPDGRGGSGACCDPPPPPASPPHRVRDTESRIAPPRPCTPPRRNNLHASVALA